MIKLRIVKKSLIGNQEISNLILFALGKSISLFGTSIYGFALSLYVLKLTGSGLSFATTLVLNMLPRVIVNPFAGVLADRFNKKTIVILMDIFNGMFLIGLYVLSSAQGLSLIMIYISVFITTVLTTIFDINIEAAIPNLVSKNQLMGINTISKIIDSAAAISGPMIGGMVYAFVEIKLFIIINAVSFIFSGILECFINFNFYKEEQKREKKKFNLIEDIKEGYIYMIGRRMLINIFAIFILLNFCISLSLSVPLPYIINNVLKLSARYFGIIQGFFPVGMILGALFIKRMVKKVSYQKLLLTMNFIIALAMIMVGIPLLVLNIEISDQVLLIYYSIIMIIVGVAISFIDIPLISILQNVIPDMYRGRVLSLGMSLVKVISPIALLLSGFMINSVPSYLLPLLGGLLLILINIFFFKNKYYHEMNTSMSGSSLN